VTILASQIFAGSEKVFEGPNSKDKARDFQELQQKRWAIITNVFNKPDESESRFLSLINNYFNVANYSIESTSEGHILISKNRPLLNEIVDNGIKADRSTTGRIKSYLFTHYGENFYGIHLELDGSFFQSYY
jgi:hypothetical protein